MFLHRHTTSTAYLKALVAAPSRFDLDGTPVGEIAQEHRQAAQQELERRRAIAAARRAVKPRGPQTPRGVEPRAPEPRPVAAPKPIRKRADAAAAAPHAPDFADPDRRERALLLRAWEASPLTKVNFCALKRLTPTELDAQLELARQERGRPPAGTSA